MKRPMNAFAFSMAMAAVFFTFLSPQARAADDQVPLNSQNSSELKFSNQATSGYLRYLPVYKTGEINQIGIMVEVAKPALLYCLDYSDFRFDLESSSGETIKATNAKHLSAAVRPMGPVAAWPGDHRPCTDPARKSAFYLFSLNTLYPQLTPGTYRLRITIDPEHTTIFQTTTLPTMTFEFR